VLDLKERVAAQLREGHPDSPLAVGSGAALRIRELGASVFMDADTLARPLKVRRVPPTPQHKCSGGAQR
jgi:hypothetical protein